VSCQYEVERSEPGPATTRGCAALVEPVIGTSILNGVPVVLEGIPRPDGDPATRGESLHMTADLED